MPWVGLQCVIVVFPDHTHFLNQYLTLLNDTMTFFRDNFEVCLVAKTTVLFNFAIQYVAKFDIFVYQTNLIFTILCFRFCI